MSQHKPGYGKVNKEYGMRMFTTKPEDDGPVWMVNFMKYKEEATYSDGSRGISGREADDLYAPVEILEELGAAIPFVGDVVLQLAGQDHAWHRIGVVKYPSRQAFLGMQNREDFQAKHEHKEAGMDFTHVVRLNIYTIDLPALMAAHDHMTAALQTLGCRHAGTLLGVTGLASPDALVEMEVTAAK